jgi:hypothetical protein
MIRRIGIAILAVALLGLAGFLLLSWRRAIAPRVHVSHNSSLMMEPLDQ